jgi:tetratricopeptide (TPR) repeat protein
MCVAIAPANAQSSGKDGGETTVDTLKKVTDLFEKEKFAEASVYLEKLVKDDPNNASLRFLYGFALVAKAKDIQDQKESTKIMIQARKELVKAKQLGFKESGLDKLIAILPEDGDSKTDGSLIDLPVQTPSLLNDKTAQEYMDKGEMYFADGDWDNAFLMYQQALKKNPKFYEAALYSGDAMLQKNEFDKAEMWYQKAIAIDPNRETAYRYSATPFMKQRKFDEARLRYIEAYITEPYNSRAMGGLKQWSEVTGVEIGHPLIDIPASVNANTNGDTNITLGLGDKSDDGSFAWMAYGLARAGWQSNKNGLSDSFKKAYPNETTYRHSLAEEYEALKLTVTTLKARMSEKDNPVKKLNPQLALLIEIYDAGLLEPYILLAMKDQGIMRDHAEYLKQGREKLRQYVLSYVAGKPAPTTLKGVS